MTIPLACADFSFPKIPHEAALDLIRALGCEAADVSLMNGCSHLRWDAAMAEPEREGAALARSLAARGLWCSDLNFTPGGESFAERALNHPDAAVRRRQREWFERALAFAASAAHAT